jgi:hypothetical protein
MAVAAWQGMCLQNVLQTLQLVITDAAGMVNTPAGRWCLRSCASASGDAHLYWWSSVWMMVLLCKATLGEVVWSDIAMTFGANCSCCYGWRTLGCCCCCCFTVMTSYGCARDITWYSFGPAAETSSGAVVVILWFT